MNRILQISYRYLTYCQKAKGILLKFLPCKEYVQWACTTPHNTSSTTIDVLDNDDLLCEILTRVPGEIVGRLKVINKRWNHLISDPSFKVNHAFRQSSRNASGLFLDSGVPGSIDYFSFDLSSPTLGTRTLHLGLPEDHGIWIVSDCNGILLLQTTKRFLGRPMYICNPTTKKNLCIPYPSGGFSKFGLAIDPLAFSRHNQYKVVNVCESYHDKLLKFKIFTPDTGCWSDSKETLPYGKGRDLFSRVSRSVYFQGTLHWLTDKATILAFDVDKDRAWIIRTPARLRRIAFKRTWFGVVDEQLNLVTVTPTGIVNYVHDYENKKWMIGRPLHRLWDTTDTDDRFHEPIFYDGDRLVLEVITVIHQPINPNRTWKKHVEIHNLRTGVSGSKVLREYSDLFPSISTLI